MIGRDCTLGFCVYVDTEVVVGDRCKVQNHVSLYRGVVLEDEVFVGPSATFTNDLIPRAQSPEWQIVHDGGAAGREHRRQCHRRLRRRIGPWAMVAAGAVVTTDVPAHALVVGVPGRVRGWVCVCGRVLGRDREALPAPMCRLRPAVDRRRINRDPGQHLSTSATSSRSWSSRYCARADSFGDPMVHRFEAAVAAVTGTRHAVAVNNGTSALITALLAHGIGAGDEVITAPFTFVATLNADPARRARRRASPTSVTTSPSIPTPSNEQSRPAPGRCSRCTSTAARRRCRSWHASPPRHGLVMVEDGAQALGARVGDRPVGAFGTACFSFYATKNVTTGEGGAVTTDDDVDRRPTATCCATRASAARTTTCARDSTSG